MTAEEIMNKVGFKKHTEKDDIIVYVKPGTGRVGFVKTDDGAWGVIVDMNEIKVPLKYLFRVGIKNFIRSHRTVVFMANEIWAIYYKLAELQGISPEAIAKYIIDKDI